jgi:hypothetical protein
MPKIKELSNDALQDYLICYQQMAHKNPENEEYQLKVQIIEKALNDRRILGEKTSPNVFVALKAKLQSWKDSKNGDK